MTAITATAGSEALAAARRADSERRRRRVQAALEHLTATGAERSIASVARRRPGSAVRSSTATATCAP